MIENACKSDFFKNGRYACSLINSIVALAPKNRPQKNDFKSAIISYAANDFGSLGDQAMFEVALRKLREKNYRKTSLMAGRTPSRQDIREFADSIIKFDECFDGGIHTTISLIKTLLSHNSLFMIGADMIDGFYSSTRSLRRIFLLHLASQLGLKTRVFGFSFNETPDEEVIQALRKLPSSVELLARDPVSQRRLEDVLDGSVKLVADLAFLLLPDATGAAARPTLEWIKARRANNATIIGINTNGLLSKGNFDDPIAVATGIARTMVDLKRKHPKIAFILISHDFRGHINDTFLNCMAREIACFNNADLRESIFEMPSPCFAAEVKAVSAELDFAITGRMHFAIACLGQGTPPLCLGYQGKMEGLLEHFDLHQQNMVLPPKEALSSSMLFEKADHIDRTTSLLREQIKKHLKKVFTLAELNFAFD